jgi:hypothetical protein
MKRTLTDADGNTLKLDQVDMVLEEVEFERSGTSDACEFDDDDSGSDDDCLEVEAGPFALSLPLDGAAPLTAFTTSIPEGRWEEVEFEVEPIDDDEANTLNTLVPVGQSIRVEGTFTPAGGTAEAFVWTTDIDGEQEIEFSPPIDVTADEPVNVTFRVNVDNWFRRADGSLINPGAIADDSEDEEIVEENIEASIEGYRDDDRDGDDDDDDDDDDDADDDENGDDASDDDSDDDDNDDSDD